jgi:uncharacterized repeat protein (TIGR01451 family)
VSAPVGTDVNPDDNSASATVSTLAFADISLTKTFSPAQPVAGGPVTYTLHVHSAGPGTVDVFAGDRLPPQLQNPTASIAGGTGVCRFDPTGESIGAPPGSAIPIIACDIPQFGPGEDRVITVQGTLAPDSAGTLVDNFAFAGAVVPFTDLTFDPDNFADNSDEVTFTPGTVDVGISKSVVGPSSIGVGDVATFRLVASNSGTVAANDVVVLDGMPAGLEPIDLPAGCLAVGQGVACALGILRPGASQTIELHARALPSAAGATLTNRAAIRTDEADLVPANDTSSADITVRPLPAPPAAPAPAPPPPTPVDLAVTVKPPTGLASVGTTGAWTVRVVNNGPGTATNVTLGDIVTGRAKLTGTNIRAASCLTSPSIKCGLGTLAPGASHTVDIDLRPTAAGKITLDGTVDAAEPDAVPPNDSDRASITVGLATVDITATVPSRTLTPGHPMPITIHAVDHGKRPARNASICVRVPKGLSVPRPARAKLRGRLLCVRLARLRPGAHRALRFRAVALPGPRARRAVLAVSVRGAGVRARRILVVLRIAAVAPRPPRFTG